MRLGHCIWVSTVRRGGSKIFIAGGGGGAKDYVRARTHHEREAWSPLTAGVQGPLKGPGSSLGFWCYLSLIFTHSDIKWDWKI